MTLNVSFETREGSVGRRNEDWAGAISNAVVVLDGVTAPHINEPAGCRHSVTWFTQHLGVRVLAMLQEDLGLAEALAEAISQTNDLHRGDCNLGSLGTPAAAVAILRYRNQAFDYLVLADTTIVLDTSRGVEVITDDRVQLAAPEATTRTRKEEIGSPGHADAVALMSVEQLKQRNVAGGYWVASTDSRAAEYAITGQIPAADLRRAAVFTDGASCLVDVFHGMDWTASLDYLQERGPHDLICLVREIEETDPKGLRWPRFKQSDDATAVLVQP